MVRDGYRNVAVLVGGLRAWEERGLPVESLRAQAAQSLSWREIAPERLLVAAQGPALVPAESTFLPRIAGQSFLEGQELPLKRAMVSMFVDMVGSTALVARSSAEDVLGVLQAFMEVVIDVAAYHCGDVHDFEGDGALLYFEGPGEAVPAAFRLRDELLERRARLATLPLPRISLDMGPVVIGIVGTRFRRTVAFVGASVHRAARLLKLAPPGAIIASDEIVESARLTDPELARAFAPFGSGTVEVDAELPPLRAWVAAAKGIPAGTGNT